MKTTATFLLLLCFTASLIGQNAVKLRRSDSYWGIHYDLHSHEKDTHLGKTLTEGMVDSFLKAARPDYMQVDCKGHPGISSYPTKVGRQAASYDKDPMALLRKVTESRNVALYVHYSGVIDNNYVKLHPGEGRFTPEGKNDGTNTSLWGPYVDKLLIPQLKELNDQYHVDGAWVDGECWSLEPDYQPVAKAEFTKMTGITNIPVKFGEPNYPAYLEMNRQKFISYLDHYVKVLHAHNPKFQVCSNWAYSTIMPEPVNTDVDFISGDLTSFNSVNSAAWNARCMVYQGKPWDLLSWSFTSDWRQTNQFRNPKSAIQICQEGAEVIALGGGYQVYFKQNEDLSLQPVCFETIKEIADFVLLRKEFCYKSIPVSSIALLYSTAGWKDKANGIYRDRGQEGIQGILIALLDGQNAVDVTMTHQLTGRLNRYKLVVIPEWEVLEPDLKIRLKEYVQNGGNLLVIGAKATRQFDDITGVKEKGRIEKSYDYIEVNKMMGQFYADLRPVELTGKAKVFAPLYSTIDLRYPSGIAASISEYGKGRIISVFSDMGESYKLSTAPVLRDLLSRAVKEIIPTPLAEVKGSHKIHVVPARKNGKLYINLINTSGDHSNPLYSGFDENPALRDIEVSISLEKQPKSIRLQPEGKSIPYQYKNGRAVLTVPEIRIHEIVEVLE